MLTAELNVASRKYIEIIKNRIEENSNEIFLITNFFIFCQVLLFYDTPFGMAHNVLQLDKLAFKVTAYFRPR